jgi:hypothetical protein
MKEQSWRLHKLKCDEESERISNALAEQQRAKAEREVRKVRPKHDTWS